MEVYNAYQMTDIAAGFCVALGVEPPRQAAPAATPLVRLIADTFGGRAAQKAVIYNPDAIAQWLWQKYNPDFAEVMRYTQLALPLKTMMPSVTPVCFGTMYTGVIPAVHGIQKYEKPVIRVDSVYDAMLRAGKRCCIVAVDNCSLSRIFNKRDMDYFFTESDEEAEEVGIQKIREDNYDFITIYNGLYDQTMHATSVEHPEALEVLRSNCRSFGRIARVVEETGYDTLLGFATDHGCHDSPETGKGTHGTDLTDDLNIVHFYGTIQGKKHGN